MHPKNIGPVSAGWLNEIGVYTLAELEETGTVSVYRRLKTRQPGVTLNLLYALQSAIMEMHWNDLPLDLRDQLRAQVEEDAV